MFIKLGIIAGIIILGGMVFSNEIDSLFPSTSATVVNSLKDDVSNFSAKAGDSVEKRIDESIDKIVDKTSNAITDEISEVGDSISNEISDVRESSQQTISDKIFNFNPVESIQNIFTDNPNVEEFTDSSINSELIEDPIIQNPTQDQSPIIYETLSLSTTQKSNDDIALQYYDSSEKTTSVNVIIRTDQKEIFSGTFFTSMFETNVNDVSSVPYYVDMIVEHEDYGTVTSSVFNPGDSSDSKINGIFSQS
jgi:gas vesicle protein